MRSVLPSWVEADPLRARAVDALGLQRSVDAIADVLVPGLSVATTRARYFSMLAWARRVCRGEADERRIHRLEVALAAREGKLHGRLTSGDEDGDAGDGGRDEERCAYIGSRKLGGWDRDRPPADPRTEAYRIPVWRAYRAPMEQLGLLDASYRLTSQGEALASSFAKACGGRLDASGRTLLPERACLSELTHGEARLIADALGIWRQGRVGEADRSPRVRRCRLEVELRRRFRGDWWLARVLDAYERVREHAPSYTRAALREAAVWERLSVGLQAVFLLWLSRRFSQREVRTLLARARRTRRRPGLPFGRIEIDEVAAVTAVQSVRRALHLRDRLAPRGGLSHCEAEVFELGAALAGTTPLDEVLEQLAARHVAAKGDDAWITMTRGKPQLARDADDKWQLPTAATLHGYRLNAFGCILHDLERARR
jgi:hypothetical protein